jgi:regulator of replication initiation timing
MKVEKAIQNKLVALELSVEELNKEVFALKKELKKATSLDALKDLEKIIETIVDDIKAIEEKNKSLYLSLKEEIRRISAEIKKNKIPEYTSITRHEEEKIINMYKSGYKVEEISRELRIPAGEIELILKFANIV